jgi:hypothetical protein
MFSNGYGGVGRLRGCRTHTSPRARLQRGAEAPKPATQGVKMADALHEMRSKGGMVAQHAEGLRRPLNRVVIALTRTIGRETRNYEHPDADRDVVLDSIGRAVRDIWVILGNKPPDRDITWVDGQYDDPPEPKRGPGPIITDPLGGYSLQINPPATPTGVAFRSAIPASEKLREIREALDELSKKKVWDRTVSLGRPGVWSSCVTCMGDLWNAMWRRCPH